MLYEQCIWRLKCFLSIQVKKYLVYLFLASWEWFLQTSALQSASTEERLSGDFLLIKSCVYEFFGVDKKWPYETKNRYIGYFMNKIDRKHIVLQVKTKNVIRFPPLEKLLSLKVMKPSKTAVKTADRSDHFKRHCTWVPCLLQPLFFPAIFGTSSSSKGYESSFHFITKVWRHQTADFSMILAHCQKALKMNHFLYGRKY